MSKLVLICIIHMLAKERLLKKTVKYCTENFAFIATVPLDEVMAQLNAASWPIVEGPVMRTGATQKIRSVYVRDPDLNLIEISELA